MIEGPSRLPGVIHQLEVNRGKPTAVTTIGVPHYLNLLQGPKLVKLLFQVSLSGVQAHSKCSYALRLPWILEVAIMTPPV